MIYNTMTSITVPADIQLFLDQYCAAFNHLDGQAVAALYAIPSSIIHEGVLTHWTSAGAVRANMVALCQMYREHGFSLATFQVKCFFHKAQITRWWICRGS